MQYEVSMTVCMGRIANQRKVPKLLPFKNYQVRITKYLMCMHEGQKGHMCTKYEASTSNPVARVVVHR